jgi:hypothetical protein
MTTVLERVESRFGDARCARMQSRWMGLRTGDIEARQESKRDGRARHHENKNKRNLELPPRRAQIVAADKTGVGPVVEMICDGHSETPMPRIRFESLKVGLLWLTGIWDFACAAAHRSAISNFSPDPATRLSGTNVKPGQKVSASADRLRLVR